MAEKASAEWMKMMIDNADNTSKEYDKYGFFSMARDVHRHKALLERVLRQEHGRRFI